MSSKLVNYVCTSMCTWSTSTKHPESRTSFRTTKPIDQLQITQSASKHLWSALILTKTAKFIERSINEASKLTIEPSELLIPTAFGFCDLLCTRRHEVCLNSTSVFLPGWFLMPTRTSTYSLAFCSLILWKQHSEVNIFHFSYFFGFKSTKQY